ncbi:ATPase, T2SS/T4P/T4SS family, partial [Klebsiella michiganensis]
MKTEQLVPLCQRYQALLLDSNEHTIAIAVVDAPAPELLEALRFATQKRIDIECWNQDQMDKRLQTPGISTLTPPVEASASIVEQVNSLLEQALRQRASDIHIEPGDDRLRIRLRVDGVLHSLAPLAPELAAPITARLKV